ncbi:MAG: ABC transporter permease [Bacteriovorax sp.]|nr:ABC transporter permease [Bacteriovorax sp.]
MTNDLRIIYVLTLANLKSRYRNTFYGFLWVVINPILIFAVQAYAFKIIFKIQYLNYTTFLLSGLLPWLFIVQSVEMCTSLFVTNAHFIRNLPVSPLVLLYTQVLDNFVNFLCSFFILIIIFFFKYPEKFNVLFLLPLPIISLALAIGSMCLVFASVNVVLRDLKFVISFFFSLLFYLTPIFYPPHFIPAEYRFMVDINPIYYIIRPFQLLTMQGAGREFFYSVAVSYGTSLMLITGAYFTWKKMKEYLIFYA